jgi:hypothetical protein
MLSHLRKLNLSGRRTMALVLLKNNLKSGEITILMKLNQDSKLMLRKNLILNLQLKSKQLKLKIQLRKINKFHQT